MAAYFEDGSPAMAQLQAMVNRIEEMVERAGLSNVLYAVESICNAKAESLHRRNPRRIAANHWHHLAAMAREGAQVVHDYAGLF
jgi:hypothetical protein